MMRRIVGPKRGMGRGIVKDYSAERTHDIWNSWIARGHGELPAPAGQAQVQNDPGLPTSTLGPHQLLRSRRITCAQWLAMTRAQRLDVARRVRFGPTSFYPSGQARANDPPLLSLWEYAQRQQDRESAYLVMLTDRHCIAAETARIRVEQVSMQRPEAIPQGPQPTVQLVEQPPSIPQPPPPTVPSYIMDAFEPKGPKPLAFAKPGGQAAVQQPSTMQIVYGLLGTASMAASAYHGYRRNESVGWGVWWGLMGALFPVVTPAIAVAQGFGRSRRRRRVSTRLGIDDTSKTLLGVT